MVFDFNVRFQFLYERKVFLIRMILAVLLESLIDLSSSVAVLLMKSFLLISTKIKQGWGEIYWLLFSLNQ